MGSFLLVHTTQQPLYLYLWHPSMVWGLQAATAVVCGPKITLPDRLPVIRCRCRPQAPPVEKAKEEPPPEAKIGDLVELFMGRGQVRGIREEDGMLEVWAMGWEMAGEQRPRYFVSRDAVKVVPTVYYKMPGGCFFFFCGCSLVRLFVRWLFCCLGLFSSLNGRRKVVLNHSSILDGVYC